MPAVERLTLARVTAVPEWHPEHATFEPFPVHAWVVRHPQGNVLLDTGIGAGHESIDEWYRPEVTSLIDALAAVPRDRLRLVDGEEEILDGVRLLPTPGHTPGHQSVVIEAGDERVVLAAQCAYRASELRSGLPGATNLHDHSWHDAARDSLNRIRSLAPLIAHLSHDPELISLP